MTTTFTKNDDVSMTPGEFKAWLTGFSEAMTGPPNTEQWDRIMSRVSSIEEKDPTIVRDTNNHHYHREWWGSPYVYNTRPWVGNQWKISSTTYDSTGADNVQYGNPAVSGFVTLNETDESKDLMSFTSADVNLIAELSATAHNIGVEEFEQIQS